MAVFNVMIMNFGFIHTACFMLSMALLASQGAMALTVYQWTDEEGVVHYSDTPPPAPEEASSEVNEIEVADVPANAAAANEYSIVNQLERMTAWRRQAEEDRRAWKQLQLEEQRLDQEQQSYQPTADTSSDIYYPYSYIPYNYYPRGYYRSYPGTFPRHTNGRGHNFPDKDFGLGHRGHEGQFATGYYQYR